MTANKGGTSVNRPERVLDVVHRGLLVAKMMLEDPSHLGMISLEEDKAMTKPVLQRSASWTV
jgi:hypothetical protein